MICFIEHLSVDMAIDIVRETIISFSLTWEQTSEYRNVKHLSICVVIDIAEEIDLRICP